MKKILFVGTVLLMVGSIFLSGAFSVVADAEESVVQTETTVTDRDIQLGVALRKNLTNYVNPEGFVQVKIVDMNTLNNILETYNYELTSDQVVNYINNFNAAIIEENGNGPLTNALEQLRPNRLSRFNTCSAVMGVAGFAHSTLYGAAAGALGVAWPIGLGIGAAVGAAYLAGGMFC
ncbi:hypothetical protein [Enterococcus sp. DIV1420a]|uniref:hypothetical protein n=1 Tax=Enterococcus TaxID=1350 RepID=UPI003F22CCD4